MSAFCRSWDGHDARRSTGIGSAVQAGQTLQQQQQQQNPQYPDEQQQAAYGQMQWVGSGYNAASADADTNYVLVGNGQQQQQQRPSMHLQAGGQRMVLDLDEYVAGVDDFYGIGGEGSAIMAA